MSLTSRLTTLRSTLSQQATPRAMIGLGVLALVLAFSLTAQLADAVERKHQTVSDLERQIAVRRAISQQSDWPERASDAAELIDSVEQRFWVGRTSGLVAAEIQTVLEAAARGAGLGQVRVTVLAEPEPLIGEIVVFEAQLVASDRNGQFLALFDSLSGEGRAIRITRFEWDRPNARIVLTLEAPAILEEAIESSPTSEAAS